MEKATLKIQSPELLAPAGDYERLEYAIQYGADAVYVGGTNYGMRASVQSFDFPTLKRAVEFAHSKGVKIYLTMNAVIRNSAFTALPTYIEQATECGVDAMIVSDLGMLSYIKKYAPNMPIHISTQMGVANFETANMVHELGAKRVVLARELSIEEITEIRAKTNPSLEIECFVHGAMCVAFSGRCLVSNYLTGRDANHGACAQSCRWKYHVVEEKRPGEYLEIQEDENGTFLFNSKDMCTISHIPELISAGITTFKLEGRAKSAYYTAVTTNAYRSALDEFAKNPSKDFKPSEWIVDEMDKMSHRQYFTGFYFDDPSKEAGTNEKSGYVRNWEVSGIVIGYENGTMLVSQRNRFFKGDELELLEPNKKPTTFVVDNMTSSDGESIDVAPHPMQIINIPFERKVPKGSILRIRKK